MTSEIMADMGVMPRPPLMVTTGRQNTLLEYDESMFRAAAEPEMDTEVGPEVESDGVVVNGDVMNSNGNVSENNNRKLPKLPEAPTPKIDEKTMQVLCGSFRDLPPRPTSTVRIFLSSTFSGTYI